MSWLTRTTDQTAQLRAEVATLRQQLAACGTEMQRVRRALDSLAVGVVLVDERGAEQVRNMPTDRFGGHAKVLVDEAVERHIRRALAGRSSAQQVEFYGPPRRVLMVEAVPLVGGGGALATIADISERVRLDSVRTDFVANISHELKTPVGALAVLAEALGDVDDPEVVTRLAAKITDEAHRASRTIDDLLELSRIELGGPAIRESVNVQLVIEEAVTRNRVAAEQRGIELVIEHGAELSAWGDARQLVSALSNLVDNAVKYSDRGAAVRVRAESDGKMVGIHVVDAGVGIPAKDLDRIFERFYRVDQARSRATGGTGLGLSIVRHVAANHGGDISVQSREGEGSTFTLRVPVCEG